MSSQNNLVRLTLLNTRIRLTGQWRLIIAIILAITALPALLGIGIQASYARIEPKKIIIDTDMGVDDAAAVAWLLSQNRFPVNVLGITTVPGNTTVENATNNVLIILDAVQRTDIPVIIGAGAPLSQTLSRTGGFVHGPDGLWFVGMQNPHDLSGLPADAPTFYCENASPEVTLVALGPLTNLAQAVAACPDEMKLYGHVVVLGGAKNGGNIVPEAEFNVWQDPEAAAQLFTAGLNVSLIPLDTFSTFTITQKDIDMLARRGTAVGKLLAGPLQFYLNAQIGLDRSDASVPDVPAVMYALHAVLGTAESALVKVVPGILDSQEPERLLRGQTIIGMTFSERMPMIANDAELSAIVDGLYGDPNFDFEAAVGAILAREPDNAQVVVSIRSRLMHTLFLHALTR